MAAGRYLSPMPAPAYDLRVAERHLTAADPALGRFISRFGRCRLELDTAGTTFRALAESIAYQQLTGKAAATIFGRLEGLFPRRKLRPAALLALPEEALRGAGLSRAKVAAMRDLARRTLDRTVPTLARLQRMEDEEVIERLVQVRGVGRWTVEMLLIFVLGRPDVWPLNDYGVQKGFQRIYGHRKLPSRTRLIRQSRRWRPYRSVAAWYFWRAAEERRDDAG